MINRKSLNIILSVILVLSLVFSQFIFAPSVLETSAQEIDVWSGNAADFAGGEGTVASPFLIENADQLYNMVVNYQTNTASKGKYFKITKDIYINDVSDGRSIEDIYNKKNWLYTYGDVINAVSKENSFSGTLDGGGHTIYGLYVDGAASGGLFPAINSYTTIKNLSLENVLVTGGGENVGALAGNAIYTTWQSAANISNCSVANATIGQWNNVKYAGGFIGYIYSTTINFTNCYANNLSMSIRESSGTPGGIIGTGESGGTLRMTNCYSTDYFITNSTLSKTVCNNVYTNVAIPEGNTTANVTVLSSEQMKGEAAKENMSGLDYKWTWDINENSYPTLKSDIIEVWDGTKSSKFAGGSGTADDPYEIENASQLAYVVSTDLTDGWSFKLVKDIRINDTTSANWKENARNWVWADVRFTGTFDGNGHTIDGLYFSGSQKRMGLFSYVGADNAGTHQAIIKNFTMTNAYIYNEETSDPNGTAFVAGQASRVAYFESIYIDETCEISTSTVSGVAGILGQSGYNVFMTKCSVHATLAGKANVGAFVGTLSSGATLTLKDSISSANVSVQGVTDRNLNSSSKNIYATVKQGTVDSVVTQLTADQMKGENAAKYMTGLSFRFVWETVENDYPVLNPRGELWDGTSVTDFSSFEGNGTEESPYLIENGSQLAFALVKNSALNKGYHYKLVKDIILNDTKVDNWKNSNPTKWLHQTANRFVGVLDGDGHNIEGLYMNTSTKRPGLVSYSQGTFKNINFIGASINYTGTSEPGVAIVAAQTSGPTDFEKIYIDETSEINATAVKGVAGLAGRGYDSTGKINITNCAVLATINTDGTECGALAGSHWNSSATVTIQNSYSTSNKPLFGGSVSLTNSYNNYSVIEDEDGTTLLTADQMKGEAAVTNMTGLHFGRHWKVVENGYPVPVLYVVPEGIWDGTVATSFDGFKGSGSEEDPYQIENGSQLAYVVSTDLTDGLNFKLVKDIKLNDTSDVQWIKSATNWVWGNVRFTGNFDGDGHTIDGLYYKGSQNRFGLFSYVGANDAGTISTTIKNIKMTNAYVTSSATEGVAILAGQTSAKTTFEKIYIDETCTISAPSTKGVAGITGYGNGKTPVIIKDSAVLATITGGSQIGAFAGAYWSSDTITIIRSFSAVEGAKLSYKALLDSNNNYGLVEDSYGTNVLASTDLMKGEAAATNMPGLDFYCTWETVENGYPVIKKDSIDSWGGAPVDTSAISYAGGEGTKANPHKIKNADQLYKMVAENSNQDVLKAAETKKYFEITADINLGNNQWYNVGGTAYPESKNYTEGFSGVVYGNGHIIYNLYNNVVVGVAGLIPVATQGTEIYDLHLVGGKLPKVEWNNYVAGGLIGVAVATNYSTPIIISGCSVEGYTVGSRDASSAFVGMSYSQSLIISDCYALNNVVEKTATKEGWENASDFVAVHGDGNGEGNSIVIKNSFSDSSATIACNKPMPITFSNVYTTLGTYDNSIDGLSKVTAAEITGDAAKENLNSFNFNQMWKTVDGAYPVHISIEKRAKLWDGTVADGFAGGKGTLESPYLISNASQLYLLANADTSATKGNYYKLTNDISISDTSYNNWQLDNPYAWTKKTAYLDGFTYGNSFAGILDGAGYTVSGLFVTDTVSNGGTYTYGLIPFISANAVIRNINVNDTYISVDGESYAGAVAGVAHVTEDDASNPLKQVYFVDVNVNNCDITAKYSSDILGGAKRGVKFNRCDGQTLESNDENNILNLECNKELSVDNDALVYNSVNGDASLFATRRVLLGTSNQKIVDINCVEGFDIADLVAIGECINAQTPEESLVWSQEFNGDSLDYSVWSRNTTMSKGTTIEYADNNTVNGETLKLYCEDTGNTDVNDNNIYSVNYGLDTLNTMSYRYGRLEMRAKIPFYSGAFPSLWLTSRSAIGYEKQSTYSTEIDIFEVFGNGEFDKGELTSNNYQMVACIHKWYNDENGNKTGVDCSCGTLSDAGNNYIVGESDRSKTFYSSAQREAWHDIVFEWTENSMVFSVDGEVYYTANREDMEGKFGVTGEDYTVDGLFEQFLCIRLNNHMRTKGGAYNYEGTDSIDPSKLNYEIDYIRLYQKNDGKSQINLK